MTSSPLLFFFHSNGMLVMLFAMPDSDSVPQPHESELFSPSITVRPKTPVMVVLSFLPGP
jgi:hypothetical protein